MTSLKFTPQSGVKDETTVQAKVPETDSAMEIYETFLSDGFVSLNRHFVQSTPIKILRDITASQSPSRYCVFLGEDFFWDKSPGPEVIKLFSCSTQLSMKFFLFI